MNTRRMLASFVPWLVFSLIVERRGANAAGVAGLVSAALSLGFLLRNRASGIKAIDCAGVVSFVVIAIVAFAGEPSLRHHIADYGRGVSTFVLAVVMLASVPVLPFTEQYARDTVVREHWGTAEFRSVNRRISAVWGGCVLVMAAGHLTYGRLAATGHGSLAPNLLLNWAVTAALTAVALQITRRTAAAHGETSPV
jgi:hypothetical protein